MERIPLERLVLSVGTFAVVCCLFNLRMVWPSHSGTPAFRSDDADDGPSIICAVLLAAGGHGEDELWYSALSLISVAC